MSSFAPKTPTRRSRNENKTPLTPTLTSGLNSMSLAEITSPGRAKKGKGPSKTPFADTTASNPFLVQNATSSKKPVVPDLPLSKSTNGLSRSMTRSRPSSPLKITDSGIKVSEELLREASGGIVKRGARNQFDVIKHDYVPPKGEMKRSKSQPAVMKRDRMLPKDQDSDLNIDPTDRFITNRAEQDLAATLDLMHLSVKSSSPGHTARLAVAAGLPVNKRVLAFHEAPPVPSSDPLLAQQREIVRPLYARPNGLTTSSGGSSAGKTRKISNQPERVLDAPGMVDDFYLNLLSWSSQNAVAVALGESTYIWRAETGSVVHVGDVGVAGESGHYVSAVDFSADGAFLGVGAGTGAVQLWDIETNTKLRTMTGHQSQVASLSWNGHILSSGCGDGSIWHHDVRVARHKVCELLGHSGEVCGLKWRSDGEMLASGGNDNVVNIWDGRVGEPVNGEAESRTSAKWTKRNHTAAVKAVAWCPWQPSILATGGGTNDSTIHIWNSTTGARLHSLKTPAQVTSLQFSPHKKEILSTHGYPTNAIMVHAYPSFERVAEIRDAHDSRVLFSSVSPAGDMVVTGAGDENLKFWRIWEVPKAGKRKEKTGSGGAPGEGIRAIR